MSRKSHSILKLTSRNKALLVVLILACIVICYSIYNPIYEEDITNTIPFVSILRNAFIGVYTYEEGFDSELQKISDTIQRRLQYIQNPPDCNTAQKVACKFDESCGYGCQVHHVVLCLVIAYATERTLVIEKTNGIYAGHNWDQIFLTLSETCTNTKGRTHGKWPHNSVQVLSVPRISDLKPQPAYIPMAIPSEFASQLERMHPDPAAWWIAQFVKFVMRYQPRMQAIIDQALTELNIGTAPRVGIHVRRTDKYVEAPLRQLDDYMAVVEDYYDQRRWQEKRRIFLASDDVEVIHEAKINYPEYDMVDNERHAASAGLKGRFSETSLNGVIIDTHILAQMDYLVCTFSSNVCRLAYVMKMALSPRTALDYTSLDDTFHFAASHYGRIVVVMPTYSYLDNL